MSVLSIGLLYGASTLVVMFAGMPIAFALGAVATLFMLFFMPAGSVDTISQNVYEEMASITLLSIPLFILKGSAIGRSRAALRTLSMILCFRMPMSQVRTDDWPANWDAPWMPASSVSCTASSAALRSRNCRSAKRNR